MRGCHSVNLAILMGKAFTYRVAGSVQWVDISFASIEDSEMVSEVIMVGDD